MGNYSLILKKSVISEKKANAFFPFGRDVDLVADAIERLGGFVLEPQVTRTTSHVICGDEKRTVNLLRGIAYGCWILNYEWVRSNDSISIGFSVFLKLFFSLN